MKEAKKKMFWYDFKTHLGLMLGVAFTVPFAVTGPGAIIVGGFVLIWYIRRLQHRPFYEARLGIGRLNTLVGEYDRTVAMFRDFVVESEFGTDFCPTCQAPYNYAELTCPNLVGVYPHKPSDPAPVPNPYEWTWFKANGYLPPPDDWPKDKMYVSQLGNDVEAMLSEGRPYYEKYGNPLWDAGYGRIPDWYINRYVRQVVESGRV